MRALIAEKSNDIRTFVKNLLQPSYNVLEAADGQEALKFVFETGPIDLALVAWNMPGMTGFDFVRAVRSRRNANGIRIMIITSKTAKLSVEEALNAGANEYLMKPFTADMLIRKIKILGLPA